MIDENLRIMSKNLKEKGSASLSYLDYKALEQFWNCFNWTFKTIKLGDKTNAEGKLGILLYGKGVIEKGGKSFTAKPGMPFGVIKYDIGRDENITFLAATDSVYILSESDLMERVCYSSCWFHGRLRMELIEILNKYR